jgi:hypothetical protein
LRVSHVLNLSGVKREFLFEFSLRFGYGKSNLID